VRKAAVVIHVQMSKHNTLHIARADTKRSQLWLNLLLALNPKDDLGSAQVVHGALH
jgi:hypothetical protein